MAAFETVEKWAGTTPGGPIELWLKHLADTFTDVWRVEYTIRGAVPRKGETFDSEDAARAEAKRIRASVGADWVKL